MSFDFNIEGRQYEYKAWTRNSTTQDILPQEADKQFQAISRFVTREWTKASEHKDEGRKTWLWRVKGCLVKLSNSLLQVSRMKSHLGQLLSYAERLVAEPETQGPCLLAVDEDEMTSDFESLLLHGRATLDRLTWFVAAEYSQKCNRFSKLANILAQQVKTEERARKVLSIIRDASPLGGILIDLDKKTSLRGFVAHYGAVSETMQNCFAVWHVGPDRILICDCESRGHPLLHTTWQLSQYLPFVVLNSLALFASVETLALENYRPTWTNPTVIVSDYIEPSEKGLKFSVVRMLPNGFQVSSRHVRASIFQKAIRFAPKNGTQT